jgi:Mrp family chromosome partitioning ATPase
MPGLGDALREAYEDSANDLDDLVQKAARGESGEQAETAPEAAAEPAAPEAAPDAARGPGGTSTLSPDELAEVLAVAEATASSDASEEAPAVGQKAPAPPPPAADREETGAEGASGTTSETAAEPIAPFAQFAPTGIIRHRLRSRAGEDEGTAGTGRAAGGAAGRADGGGSPRVSPPADEDVLAVCRQMPALERPEDYRIPGLAEGVAGAVRAIRGGSAGHPAVVAFCGACPRAGTTTVALAAALSLAEEGGSRVLLVDADFASPGLAKLIGSAGGAGLSAVLRGEATLGQSLLYDREENLALLPIYAHGEHGPRRRRDFGRLLGADAIRRFIAGCRAQFDCVLLDAGNAAGWDDPARLAAAGHAVLVVRSGRVTLAAASRLQSRLEKTGVQLLGSLLTFA